MTATNTLDTLLRTRTVPGRFYEKQAGNKVRCYACGHYCSIGEGQAGICKVRYNRGGVLYVPHGYVAGLAADPIEKKPFYHVYPGSTAMSFGMLGCDLHCSYCQNWETSQALRDPDAGGTIQPISPQSIVELAKKYNCRVLTSTYNEPLITAEWAISVFEEGKKHGLEGSFVSNGNASPEIIRALKPYVKFYKVDLKSFDDAHYLTLGCKLSTVLKSLEQLVSEGFWVEIVTLLVPGFNDSEKELRGMARFIKSLSEDIPWHLTGFHLDYHMNDGRDTTAADLKRACKIGVEEGLRFVYAGNRPGETGEWEHTRCPDCKKILVERFGFHIMSNHIKDGICPDCQEPIPGFWE